MHPDPAVFNVSVLLAYQLTFQQQRSVGAVYNMAADSWDSFRSLASASQGSLTEHGQNVQLRMEQLSVSVHPVGRSHTC